MILNLIFLKEFERTILTRIRKVFHMLIMVVFSLGFVYDRHLLYLCSFGMLLLLSLCEIIRYYKIEPIGKLIQDSLVVFLDEKDQNSSLIMSHVYLLIGLAYPLWLSDLNGNQIFSIMYFQKRTYNQKIYIVYLFTNIKSAN